MIGWTYIPYSASRISLIFLARTGSPTISGTIWVTLSITGSPASRNMVFSIAAAACWPSRSALDSFR